SIYLGRPALAALECLAGEYGDNRSGRINSVCERYLAMVADELSRLPFSRAEWCAILDANNGVDVYEMNSPPMMWANVHDTRDGRSTRRNLVRRLQQLPKSSLIAIQEACDRF